MNQVETFMIKVLLKSHQMLLLRVIANQKMLLIIKKIIIMKHHQVLKMQNFVLILKKNKIQVTNYSIKTSVSGFRLKKWVFEASNDGKNWEIIDEHVNDSALNKSNAIVTFDIKKSFEISSCFFFVDCNSIPIY